jgi:hypothetical protein
MPRPARVTRRRHAVTVLGVGLAAVLTAAGAAPGAAPAAPSSAGARVADSADDRVSRVVVISVDGLASSVVRGLGPSRAPALHRMIRDGASTLNARTLLESTSTLPNHTGMVTGRRVAKAFGGHGVDFNTDTGVTVHRAAGEYTSSVFSVVHDHGGSTAMYAGKSKFDVLDRSWNARHGAPDRAGANQGRDKIDRYVNDDDAGLLTNRLVRQLRRNPATFSFLHLRLPDSAGHESGYLSRPYRRAVRQSDELVGRVLSTIAGRPGLRGSTVVVLTADHGGHGGAGSKSHSNPRILGNYRIPFLVWGASVARGVDLYAVNSDRQNPGDSRPDYRGTQPVRNAEVANLTTDLLDLPAVPGAQLDVPRNLAMNAR